MNIAQSFKLIKPQIATKVKPPLTSKVTLKAVYEAIRNGFNMTNKGASKVTGLSEGCVSRAITELYNANILSRIEINKGQRDYCWGYTVRGDL